MAAKPTICTINGRTYVIGTWTVDKALETMVWITKTFGEGFLSLFMSGDGLDSAAKLIEKNDPEKERSEEDLEAEKTLIMEFASKIRDQLNAKEYVHYSKIIVDGIRCDGQAIHFNTHFSGKMFELHRLMLACLRHQYGDFLGVNAEDGL